MTLRSFPLAPLATFIVFAFVLSACDEGVDPTGGGDEVFTLWGYLDPTADQQAIRLAPITDRLDEEVDDTVDAVVTVTDLASAETITFRDSLVTFEDGRTGYVFVADWTPQFGRPYRLEARRSDGRMATVDVGVPPLVDAQVGEAQGSLEDVTYPFSFVGAPNVFAAEIDLFVTGLAEAPADTARLTVPLPSARGAEDEVEVAFVSTVRAFLSSRELDNGSLRLLRAELVAFVANEEWDVPTGRFDDPDEVVEPGTVTNVTGGFGFVGGGYFTRTRWSPSINTQIRAGFGSSEDGAARLRINEISASAGWMELYNPLDEVVNIGGYVVSDAASGGQRTELPGNANIAARGFYVVDLEFPVLTPSTLYFLTGSGREILQRNVEAVPAGTTLGSYPDGRSMVLRIGNDAQDLMGGPLVPTRGAPNVPDVQPVLLNELFTNGTGWAEIYHVDEPEVTVRNIRVITTDREVLSRPTVTVPAPGGLAVANESESGGLVLPQQGGEVFVLVGYSETPEPTAPVRFRVVDARAYGLQDPSRSEGRLPDGGDWRQNLTPTRGVPNTASGA
ncbi:MAG: hypothetical protein AAGI52_08890 [Bacteroidota bacterium]